MASKNLVPSPLTPKEIQTPYAVKGAVCSSIQCGLYKHKEDLCLFQFNNGTSVAGVFTQSQMASPPVLKCKQNLQNQKASALIVNSGNSFTTTGKAGEDATDKIIKAVAVELKIPEEEIFICSTGIIGELPDIAKIINALPQLHNNLNPNHILHCAKAIMTTDTFPKVCSKTIKIGDEKIIITGIAKGSGMIEPNMATMLSFIFTDANISSNALQTLLNQHVETTFNAITVDSDTSTSDSLIAFATKESKIDLEINLKALEIFSIALEEVMRDLAHQIIKDGEGASKFITINVIGAKNDKSAKVIAKAVANSPLVKTAIAGSDPNWGRIAMAIGKTSEDISLTNLSIAIGKHTIYANEALHPQYSEDAVYYYMRGAFVEINIDVGVASGISTVWTCDLTHGYIDINTDYRS
ncbi:MAG: glutamate N-acetyltransferase/amino-acid N-acetyltransferase [Candidatus Deianiraeaceae bacterium]|jgi:glutamate N-acetyltransferase/amino-acid N-acetyltransferase